MLILLRRVSNRAVYTRGSLWPCVKIPLGLTCSVGRIVLRAGFAAVRSAWRDFELVDVRRPSRAFASLHFVRTFSYLSRLIVGPQYGALRFW